MKLINPNVLKQQDFQDYSESDVEYAIDHCPTVEAEPIVHAHWVDDIYCSRCKGFNEDDEGNILMSYTDFCPFCGAKMDEGVN